MELKIGLLNIRDFSLFISQYNNVCSFDGTERQQVTELKPLGYEEATWALVPAVHQDFYCGAGEFMNEVLIFHVVY